MNKFFYITITVLENIGLPYEAMVFYWLHSININDLKLKFSENFEHISRRILVFLLLTLNV